MVINFCTRALNDKKKAKRDGSWGGKGVKWKTEHVDMVGRKTTEAEVVM